jgi:hypothetical protein
MSHGCIMSCLVGGIVTLIPSPSDFSSDFRHILFNNFVMLSGDSLKFTRSKKKQIQFCYSRKPDPNYCISCICRDDFVTVRQIRVKFRSTVDSNNFASFSCELVFAILAEHAYHGVDDNSRLEWTVFVKF